jgi:hypothetical protein
MQSPRSDTVSEPESPAPKQHQFVQHTALPTAAQSPQHNANATEHRSAGKQRMQYRPKIKASASQEFKSPAEPATPGSTTSATSNTELIATDQRVTRTPSPALSSANQAETAEDSQQGQNASSSDPLAGLQSDERHKTAGDKFKGYIQGYLLSRDLSDFLASVRELKAPELHWQLVKQGLNLCIDEVKEDRRNAVADLLTELCTREHLIAVQDFTKGVRDVFENLPDLQIDAPQAFNTFGHVTGSWISHGCLTLEFLQNCPADFVQTGSAASIVGSLLQNVLSRPSTPDVKALLSQSSLNLRSFLTSNTEEAWERFLATPKLSGVAAKLREL